MKNEVVTFEQALELCKLGFDESTCCGYLIENRELYLCQIEDEEFYKPEKDLHAPLKQQVFRWFREKHKLYAHVRESYSFDNSLEFVAQINGSHISHGIKDKPINRFDTYEEAENACIDKLIEIIKNQTK